jgi:serine phosphatase RsbU (regulator of sigma subunit)
VFARIVTYTADPSPHLQSATVANIEQGLRRTWERLPGVRQLEGIESAYFFVDRQRGKAIFISLWESEEAMNNSEEVMRPLRAELSEAFAANRVDVEHYEVGDVLVQEIRERELLEQELEVARSIQQASLPKEVPTLEGWQITPFYQPAREVGGDFYDFHLLSEGRLGVVVGDATGKGVPAALVMSTTCGMLQLAARALGSPSPGEVLEQVNETLFARIPQNMFVTCFYAILDPESGTLRYANAGHDLPYLRRVGGDAEELRARGMPLGLMPGMNYEQKEIVLEEGEAALFYSDGLVEAHDPKGEMFGFPRLRALIAEHGEEQALGDFLLEELYTFVEEGWEQEDDITLLTLRRSRIRS